MAKQTRSPLEQERVKRLQEALDALSPEAKKMCRAILVDGPMERVMLTRCDGPHGGELLGGFEDAFLEVVYPVPLGPPYVQVKGAYGAAFEACLLGS